MTEIQNFKKQWHMESAPTFVNGFSSGGATAAGLLACFPGEFAAGSLHSAPPYGYADGPATVVAKLNKPVSGDNPPDRDCSTRNFKGRLLVIQGSADDIVAPANAQTLVREFVGDLPSTEDHTAANKTKFTVFEFGDRKSPRATLVSIEGLPHAWSGANLNQAHSDLLGTTGKFPTQIPFFADSGPSATDMSWEFFKTGRVR